MGRTIRIDYGFTFEGKEHYGNQVLAGDTIYGKTPENENRMSAIYDALDIDVVDFLERWGEPFAWTEENWKKAGFNFEYCNEVE